MFFIKITHKKLFYDAIFHPKKHAAFRLLPIGKLIQFLFILALIISIPSYIEFIDGLRHQKSSVDGLANFLTNINWLLYPLSFVFIVLFNMTLIVLQASFYGGGAYILLQLFRRRGEYRMVWRTASFSMIPGILITTVLAYLFSASSWFYFIAILLTIIYLVIAVQKYPKKPPIK